MYIDLSWLLFFGKGKKLQAKTHVQSWLILKKKWNITFLNTYNVTVMKQLPIFQFLIYSHKTLSKNGQMMLCPLSSWEAFASCVEVFSGSPGLGSGQWELGPRLLRLTIIPSPTAPAFSFSPFLFCSSNCNHPSSFNAAFGHLATIFLWGLSSLFLSFCLLPVFD